MQMTRRFKPPPGRFECLVTQAADVGCANDQPASRFEQPPAFVQASNRVWHVLNDVAHGHCVIRGFFNGRRLEVAHFKIDSVFLCADLDRRRVKVHSFALPALLLH